MRLKASTSRAQDWCNGYLETYVPQAQDEHATFVTLAESGRLLVGVDRVFARRFYTDTPLNTINANTGEAPYLEKLLVMTAFVGGPVLLALACVWIAYIIRWWAIIALPGAVAAWIAFYAASCRRNASLGWVSVVAIGLALAATLKLFAHGQLFGALAVYVSALWMARFVYVSATFFLRAFVIRNSQAFHWLRDEIHTREAAV